MKLAFVHNPDESAWHRAVWQPGHTAPLRQALCGARAATISERDANDSWAHVWARVIEPAGETCQECARLAVRIWGQGEPTSGPVHYWLKRHTDDEQAQDIARRMLESVFGNSGPRL